MRRTFRTFSLMHITKVLLDGTLVPKVEDAVELPPSGVSRIGTATTPGAETTVSDAEPAGADSGGDSDDEEVAAGRYSSRPVTAVIMKFNDSGVLGSVTDAQGGDVHAMEAGEALEDSGSDMRPGTGEGGRPTSRAVSRPSTRSKMWDLPPLGRASSPFATSSPMASAPRTAGALFEAPLNVLASANCDAIAEVSEVPSEATGAECREELFSHELPYLSPTRASTKKLVGPESFAEVNSECPQGSAALIAATESLKVLDPADEKVAYQPSLLDNPESDFSQSNSVDLDVLGLLSDLQFARKLSVPPPTDTFVHKRSSRSVLKVVDGRPPSGLLFNMVKPGTPAGNVPLPCSASKGSPMDKITKAKEFPKTPFSKQLKKPAKIVNSSDATASAEKHASNPEAANLVQKQAVPPAPASLQLPPARPKGLYILPGTTTVASFAQKPPTQLKPSRQIVYSTRVLMQQKLREYINSPAAAADGLIATGGMDAYFVAGREGGFPGFKKKDSTDSDLHYQIGSNLLEFSDNLPPSTADNVATDISSFGEEAILFPPMNAFEDARIPTAEKERADMHSAWTAPTVSSEKAPAPSSAPAAGNGGDVGGECSASARNVMPPPAISDSESDDCGAGVGVGAGDLQLSMAEWNLILDAAREQAAGLNLDILQQTELEDQCTVAGAESVDEDFEGNLIDEGMSAFAIPLSSLRDYYCDPLGTQENAYMLNEGPTPLLTVGKAIKLYSNGEDCTSAPMWCYTETTSDNAASAAQTEECNSVEVQSAATVVPKLATIGVASFNLYARTSHTAQHQQTGNLFEPAAAVEESVLEKFLKTAGVTPIISSNNAARPTSSHRKRSPVQGGLDPNLEESLRPTTPLRVTTPSKGRHKHSNFLDSEVERAAGKKIVPPLQGKVYFDDEEPAAANFPPLMIVKLVKPVVPVRVPDKSPPRHHYSQTIIPAGEAVEAAEASREAAKSRNPKAIVVPVPSLVVQEDEHSIV